MSANRPDPVTGSPIPGGAKTLGLALDDTQIALLHRYLDLLEKWNAAYNLTAVRGRKAMEIEHILDSLAVVPHVREGLVVDVGSGAGLPGLVLAIALPQNSYLLIDSNGKKTRFLRQVVHELGLVNVDVVQARIEEVVLPKAVAASAAGFAAMPTTIISRAFAALPDMVQGCRKLLAPGVHLLAMKGARPDNEIAALPADVMVEQVIPLLVPGLNKERHLVCITLRGHV